MRVFFLSPKDHEKRARNNAVEGPTSDAETHAMLFSMNSSLYSNFVHPCWLPWENGIFWGVKETLPLLLDRQGIKRI